MYSDGVAPDYVAPEFHSNNNGHGNDVISHCCKDNCNNVIVFDTELSNAAYDASHITHSNEVATNFVTPECVTKQILIVNMHQIIVATIFGTMFVQSKTMLCIPAQHTVHLHLTIYVPAG